MSNNQYTQLSYEERIVIENRLKNGESYNHIAETLGRSESTISREVNGFIEKQIKYLPGCTRDKTRTRVNTPKIATLDSRKFRGRAIVGDIRNAKRNVQKRQALLYRIHAYDAELAQKYADKRHANVQRVPRRLSGSAYNKTLEYINERLKLRWSPEQISMRINRLLTDRTLKDDDGWTGDMGLRPISHMAIYRYIYGLKGKDRDEAVSHLRRRGKPFKNTAKLPYNNTNRGKHSIHDRPEEIDNLESYDDLEGDTIFGLDTSDRLLTHTERKSGLGSISLVIGYNATNITIQTQKDIERVFGRDNVDTITYDNGIEFSAWRTTGEALGVDIYFADPYHSGQRGRNENFNGLIRDFIPKRTDFKKLTPQCILEIENLLNNRPRKRLGGLTPLEVFRANCAVKVLT